MRHGRVLGEHRLECQRGGHAGHHDQQDDGGEVDRVYHADGKTLLRHDQCHLAASHHADTNLQGVAPVEAADLGSQTAADDLGDQCHNHKADAEQQDLRGQAADIGLKADGGKEDRCKDDIVADIHPALHIGCVIHGAQHDAGNVGTGNIGNAKVGLGHIGHAKAEGQAHDGDTLGVRVAPIQPLHGVMDHQAHTHSGGKEQQGVEQHLAQTRTGAAAGTQHTGKHHDTHHIVNNGCTDDGGAQKALQVTQLLQGGHRDGHAGGGHDGTDEQRTVELRAAHCGKAVEGTI